MTHPINGSPALADGQAPQRPPASPHLTRGVGGRPDTVINALTDPASLPMPPTSLSGLSGPGGLTGLGSEVPSGVAGALDAQALQQVVGEIRAQVNTLAEGRREHGGGLGEEERAALGEELTAAWLRQQAQDRIHAGTPALPASSVELLRAEVRAALSPLGVMTRFLDPHLWSDVEVNGAANVICTRRASSERHVFASPFLSDTQAWDWASEHAANAGRRFDESNPSVRFRLPGGVRVHAVGRVTSHTHLSFRMWSAGLDTLADLHEGGMFGPDLAALLSATAAVSEPLGIIFAGGTGVGKTTMLRAWLNGHPDETVLGRVVTVEDEQELHLDPQRFLNLIEFEAREANVDGKGAYTMARYLSDDLRRMTPERVGLGELKPDGGVIPLLLTVGQGIAQGVGTTIHAPSASDVLTRILTYAEFGAHRLSEQTVLKTVAASVDVVVHVSRIGGRRVVSSVHEYADVRDGQLTSAELWRYDPAAGRAVRTDLEITEQLAAKLTAAGLDPAVLDRDPRQAHR